MPNAPNERKIAHLRVRDLIANPNNARTHSPRQVEQIARSIQKFGFNCPVLIDGGNHILAGHGRVAAAKLLGLALVPTLRIDHLTDTEKRAYAIARTAGQRISGRPYHRKCLRESDRNHA